jgi:hypothetical protein
MKIECELKDIDHDEVVDAMARRLLERWSAAEGEDSGGPGAMGERLGRAVNERIKQIADSLVRAAFDSTIKDRISAAVDAVLAEGWYETDSYGGRKGERIDLKARIGKTLTEARGDSYHRNPSLLHERLDATIKGFLDKEFSEVIHAAKTTLKEQLDTSVMRTVADTIKAALGLR